MKLSLLLLLATIIKKRTLKADDCDISKHPYMVSITEMNHLNYPNVTDYQFGTGIIITNTWVLTDTSIVSHNDSFSDFKVLGGRNYELPAKTDKFRTIKRVVFDPNKRDSIHGPTLIELNEPFEKSDGAEPAKLPVNANFINRCKNTSKKMTLIGWGTRRSGYSDTNKELTKELADKLGDTFKCAKVREMKECYYLPSTKFCFYIEATTQMCRSDLKFGVGYGVLCEDILVGFGGWEKSLADDCKPTDASAYDISKFMNWLRRDTGLTTVTPEPTTAENARRTFITHHDSTSDEENPEIPSKGHHISSIQCLYALSICLHLIL